MSEQGYRKQLVEHGNAIHAALEATSAPVRDFIRQRGYQLDLYPLDFTTKLIADLEVFWQEAAREATPPAPSSVDCPACGEAVRQVASATLSLALWQHWNWACPRRGATPAPPAGERRRRRDHFQECSDATKVKPIVHADDCEWSDGQHPQPCTCGAEPAMTPEGLCTRCSATQYCSEHEPSAPAGETARDKDWTISELRRQLSNSRFDHAEAVRRENTAQCLAADRLARVEQLAAKLAATAIERDEAQADYRAEVAVGKNIASALRRCERAGETARERLAALVEEMRDALGNIGTLLAFTPRDVKRLDEQATRASRTIDRLAALLSAPEEG